MVNCTVLGNEKGEIGIQNRNQSYFIWSDQWQDWRQKEDGGVDVRSNLVMTVSENVVLMNVCSPAEKVKIWNSYFMVRPFMNSDSNANIDI